MALSTQNTFSLSLGFFLFFFCLSLCIGRDAPLATSFYVLWEREYFVSGSLISWGLALGNTFGWRQSKRTQWLGFPEDQPQERLPDPACLPQTCSLCSSLPSWKLHSTQILLTFKEEIWLLNKNQEGVRQAHWLDASWGMLGGKLWIQKFMLAEAPRGCARLSMAWMGLESVSAAQVKVPDWVCFHHALQVWLWCPH